jgi:hypothetical protein
MNLKEQVKKIIAKKKNTESPNSVDFINSVSDKIDKKEKKNINDAINKNGMDGNGRFTKIDHALSKLHEILRDEELEIDDILNADIFRPDSGSKSFNLARKTKDSFSPLSIKNSKLSFSWHLTGSPSEDKSKRKYEIVSYLS